MIPTIGKRSTRDWIMLPCRFEEEEIKAIYALAAEVRTSKAEVVRLLVKRGLKHLRKELEQAGPEAE